MATGFQARCPSIKLNERGCGFYSWKPFIIQKKLEETLEGEIVFYCDVGRTFPYKLLSSSLNVFLNWMQDNQQSIMPGVQIPWNGPMSMWTKRDAFELMSMDSPQVHSSAPIQASFSIWISNPNSKDIVNEWMNFSADRKMISDDPSKLGLTELPDFHEHRWDQSLLSLLCFKKKLKGLEVGLHPPDIDLKNPSEVATFLSGYTSEPTSSGKLVAQFSSGIEKLEKIARKHIKFN